MPTIIDATLPSEQDSRLARETGEHLAALLLRDSSAPLRIHPSNDRDLELSLPRPVVKLLLDALREIGEGNGVTLTPVSKELTTQKAAEFLMVSRPFFIAELLDKGKIPYRKVGNRRRVRYADLLRYKQAEEQEIARREQVMLELMAETERLGLYK